MFGGHRSAAQASDAAAERGGGDVSGRANSGNHANEHQILLSNAIACRLKIGGEETVAKAVDDAKKARDPRHQFGVAVGTEVNYCMAAD